MVNTSLNQPTDSSSTCVKPFLPNEPILENHEIAIAPANSLSCKGLLACEAQICLSTRFSLPQTFPTTEKQRIMLCTEKLVQNLLNLNFQKDTNNKTIFFGFGWTVNVNKRCLGRILNAFHLKQQLRGKTKQPLHLQSTENSPESGTG